jgi:hypothetical protein
MKYLILLSLLIIMSCTSLSNQQLQALAMRPLSPQEDCYRYGPEESLPIMIVLHGHMGPIVVMDTCVEWRNCSTTYKVKFVDGRGWVEYSKSEYHIENARTQRP